MNSDNVFDRFMELLFNLDTVSLNIGEVSEAIFTTKEIYEAIQEAVVEGRNMSNPTKHKSITPGGWPDGDWENRIPTPKGELHRRICEELNNTYKKKNADYGDSFARTRDKYPMAIMVRLWDKINRLETLLNGKRAEVDESIDDTLLDLANYAIIELMERKVDKAVVR